MVVIVVGLVVLVECCCSIPQMILICKLVEYGCGFDSPGGRIFSHLLHSSRKLARYSSLYRSKPALLYARPDSLMDHLSDSIILFSVQPLMS